MQAYRIRRVDNEPEAIGLGSMLRSVFGKPAPACGAPARQASTITFSAILDKRLVGSITLQKSMRAAPGSPACGRGVATVVQFDVDADHPAPNCREALLDVGVQWALANECDVIEAVLPREASAQVEALLADGFTVVDPLAPPAGAAAPWVLALPLAHAKPHSDAWYSKHHGAWFASVAQH